MSEFIYGTRKRIKPPCKDCTERHEGCHSACEAYLEYSADRERIRKERLKSINQYELKAKRKKWRE